MGRRISKSNENVGLHLVRYPWEIEPFEPYERLETYSLYLNKENREQNDSYKKNTRSDSNVKATTRVGDRVYNKKFNKKRKGLTAVIIHSDQNSISVLWDVDGEENLFVHKYWLKEVPLQSINEYPSIYRKIQDTNSFFCIRFDNMVNPKWIKGFLNPIFSSAVDDLKFSLFEKERGDEKTEKTDIYSKFELKAYISTYTDDKIWWEEFFIKALNQFRAAGIDYVGIPYFYDLFKLKKGADIIRIGFETALKWTKSNSDFNVRIIFLCCSLNAYNEYKKMFDEHTVSEHKEDFE